MSDKVIERAADLVMMRIPEANATVIQPASGEGTVMLSEEEAKRLREKPTEKLEKKPVVPDVPEQVLRPQKIIAAIHQRRELRARLVAEKLRRGVEIETELRQAVKDRDARLEAVEAEARTRLAAIAGAFEDLGQERAGELNYRDLEISKIDTTLDQLRKQLEAELGKLDPDRKVTA